MGSKNEQGLPLVTTLAARGWVCVSIDYRLSPRATFPDHLIDVKRAMAWVRTHVHEHGGDPAFVAITGGSAGGHLAALAALTSDDASYQPGFESADTSVAACVPCYGVYDLLDREGTWRHRGLARLMERHVLKTSVAADARAFQRASPVDRVHPGAPPFLIVHGDADSMVPVAQARLFRKALVAAGATRVGYAEIPGAQHAFDLFHSLRSALVVDGVVRFLEHVHANAARPGGEMATNGDPVGSRTRRAVEAPAPAGG
jgi:acetyl esterase/lipase